MNHDRDQIVADTDLRDLATELLGEPKRFGRTAMWPSPVPGHPQTGKTPPMSIKDYPDGTQRWHCFATGEGGTAIDLVQTVHGVGFTDALEILANRSNTQRPPTPAPRPARPPGNPDPRLQGWIRRCRHQLTAGSPAWRYLTSRGITDRDITHHQIGYNPPRRRWDDDDPFPKAEGVVFPVLNPQGEPIYAQVRTLNWPDVKYVSLRSDIAANPQISWHTTNTRPTPLVLTEGLPDAYAANRAGYDAAAYLGTGASRNEDAAHQIITHAHTTGVNVVVCFDGDHDGRTAAEQLTKALCPHVRVQNITPPDGHDLETWLNAEPDALNQQQRNRTRTPVPNRGR